MELIEITSAYPRLQAGVKQTLGPFVGGLIVVAPVDTGATDSVRCRPHMITGGDPVVVRTAMTWSPTGTYSPGHSPTRETNKSSPGVSPVPSECGLEGGDRPNPMVGFLRVYAEEVKRSFHSALSILLFESYTRRHKPVRNREQL